MPRITIHAFCAKPQDDGDLIRAAPPATGAWSAPRPRCARAGSRRRGRVLPEPAHALAGDRRVDRPGPAPAVAARPPGRGLRSRHQGDRDRPCQRHRPLSRADAPRGQRVSGRADEDAAADQRHHQPLRRDPVGPVHRPPDRLRCCAKGGSASSTHGAQRRARDLRADACRHGDRRPRPAVRHRRPQLQPRSAAGHPRRPVAARPPGPGADGPDDGQAHRPPQPVRRPGHPGAGLRHHHRDVRGSDPQDPRLGPLCGARPAACLEPVEEADAPDLRRSGHRRRAGSRIAPQRQEHHRPGQGREAQRRAAQGDPQQGRSAQQAGDSAQGLRRDPRASSRRWPFRSTPRCSARPPTTAR